MKTFKWCPQSAIRRCDVWFKVPHTHIGITSQDSEHVLPSCWAPDSLFLKFDDCTDKSPQEYRFKEKHAKAIMEFVRRVPDDMLIVVNCEAGISRSAGVVLALRWHYGGDKEEIFERAIPNIYVADLLKDFITREKVPT